MSWILTGVSPAILAALAASVGASIVLLYVLKVRRRRVSVPYSPLWRQVLDQSRPARLWDRVAWLVSLLIHLLVLLLLLLALGDPRRENVLREGRSVVLIVDTSASMATRDEAGSRSRIERARDEAREVVAALGPRDEVMLVTVDGQLRPLTPFSDDLGLVEEAIAGIDARATGADVEQALRFAVDSLAGRPRGRVVLISDAAFGRGVDATLDVAIPQTAEFVHVPVGTSGDNVGISAFNVRRYPANRTEYEVYVRVDSQVDAPLTVELEIRGGGRLVHVEQLPLGPGEHAVRIFPDLPAAGRELEARVRVVSGDAVDRFELDDVAHALLPDRRPIRVLLVTPGNLYLEGPLLLNESLELTTIAPAEYTAPNLGDPSADYDLTIFDRVAPPIADAGNFMYFSPSGEDSPWPVEADVVDPIIHSMQRGHPLVRWISGLRDVNVARARRLELSEDDRVVASAIGGSPILVARESMRRRLVGVAFDVADTDLPLRVAWPVLLLNAIDWFTRDSSSLIEAYRTGETWFVPIGDRSVETVSVTTPSGRRFDAAAADGVAVFYGEEVGVHRVAAGERVVRVAGNLANPSESRIDPGGPLSIDGVEARDGLEDAGSDRWADPWTILVVIAFVVVLVEWWLWNRRVTV